MNRRIPTTRSDAPAYLARYQERKAQATPGPSFTDKGEEIGRAHV